MFGKASVFGFDVQKESIQARQLIDIVHETSNVYDDLTAWQNTIFSAKLCHVGKIQGEEKVEERIGILGCNVHRATRFEGFHGR